MWGADRATLRSRFDKSRSFGLRPLVLSHFASEALNRVENMPSLVTVGSDEVPASGTVPSFAVGVGEGDHDGGDMPSKR